MQTDSSRALVQVAAHHRLALETVGQADRVRVTKAGIEVVVTVPHTVLEWYVDAMDAGAGREWHEWFDYEGYDSTPRADLDAAMASDVRAFVSAVVERDLRMMREGKNALLEWRLDGAWKVAGL